VDVSIRIKAAPPMNLPSEQEDHIEQDAYWKLHYGELKIKVFAPKYYYSRNQKKDEYSYKIVQSKTYDLSDFFFEDIKKIFDKLPFKPELIVVAPASQVNSFSPTLLKLGEKLSRELGIPNENILTRSVFRKKMIMCKDSEERFQAVKDTLRLTDNPKNKRIVLLDDTRTSGVSLLECAKVLFGAEAEDVIAVCLGINKLGG